MTRSLYEDAYACCACMVVPEVYNQLVIVYMTAYSFFNTAPFYKDDHITKDDLTFLYCMLDVNFIGISEMSSTVYVS